MAGAEAFREDVAASWRRPSLDLERDSIIVLDADRPAGMAEVSGRHAEVAVHPGVRGRGIGSWLLAWTEARAREIGTDRIGQNICDVAHPAIALLTATGYRPRWSSWVLEKPLGPEPLAPPAPPSGVEIRALEPGHDERPTYELIESAFSEWADREPTSFEDWAAAWFEGYECDPSLAFLAVEGPDIVGAALCAQNPGAGGWVYELAARTEDRGRGIAKALLQHAFGEFHRRGERSVGLPTDSRTGALGLYERVGMRVSKSFTHLAKDLRPAR